MNIKHNSLCSTPEEVSLVIKLMKKLSVAKSYVDFEKDLEISERDLIHQTWNSEILSEITCYNPNDETDNWKYLCVLFYCVIYLDKSFLQKTELECLSVQQTKDLKDVVGTIVKDGILENLHPTIIRNSTADHSTDLLHYRKLLATLSGVTTKLKCPFIKSLLVTSYLKEILLAFYQIIYCPLKKPNSQMTNFIMTQETYDFLMKDRENFKHIFKNFVSSIHPMLYIRETMLLLDKSSPNWLKKSLSNTLSAIIRSPKGVQNVVWAMLDSVGLDELDDSTKSWKIILLIAKLIVETCRCPDFKENTSKQLYDLLKLRSRSGEPYKPFERLFSLCTRLLYQQNESLCQDVCIKNMLAPLMSFINCREVSDCQSVSSDVEQSIRICYYLSCDTKFDIPLIPVKIILPVCNVIFCLFLISDMESKLHEDTKNILMTCLCNTELSQKFAIFDTFLFGYPHVDILELPKELEFYMENSRIMLKQQTYSVRISYSDRAEGLLNVIKGNITIKTVFLSYLLNCLSESDKYFRGNLGNQHLLHLEDMPILQEYSERSLVVYRILAELFSDQRMQSSITENPELVIKYIHTAIQNCITKNIHKSKESDCTDFQTLFLLIMLIQIFVENSTFEFKGFIDILKLIYVESTNRELKELCSQVVRKLNTGKPVPISTLKSELELALQDICDPLLPVRGHALMTLSKLIEKKDKEAMERKQYILNIFLQNLKNDDSFIYLSAIGGLSSMGDVFPDTVLNIIADEYVDFSRKGSEDGHEVRMKLGEVLVRITRILGEMVPKYKTLLLNTFLQVTKDDDHLMRASSLSNLGEVCKLLGYKLGSIVSEVLVCVHSIISTDKAPEPRRAAVAVIQQLFVGLEKETILFLKDEILPIYRTLKNIYNHDKDEVMRLQAQLALEQLNENMKDFIFPNLQLHIEKKIIMLN